MSRGRRKTPIFGFTTAESDAEWKAKAARCLRHKVRQSRVAGQEAEQFAGKRWDAVNPYDAPKDGQRWCGKVEAHWLRNKPCAA